MDIDTSSDLPSHSSNLSNSTTRESETAARLAWQSAEENLETKTGKRLKTFSEKLLKKLVINELRERKKVKKSDNNSVNSLQFNPNQPLSDLNQLTESSHITIDINNSEKGGKNIETEISINDIDGQNITPNEIQVYPKVTPEPDYEKIDLLDWSQLMVEIRSLVFSYSRKKKFLDNVNMSVPKSAIYGLLGPSGCGKTTLLRLILGLIRQKSGSIKVNGKKPGDPKGNIPGAGVGFMPQELAIHEEFTLNEALKYFGRLYGMSDQNILSRIRFLVDFLDLPDPERQIKYMSGGQKRRVSLSLTLVHNPPLLILDEPTVGTDPVLRERIWEHLLVLSQKYSTTILITTHYIEEARRAHVVSLMRDGSLLVEHSPVFLLKQMNVQSLEDVFLRVCKHGANDKEPLPQNYYDSRKGDTNEINNNLKIISNKTETQTKINISDKDQSQTRVTYTKRVVNQTHKNVIHLIRNKPLLIFQTILPTICIIMFCLCIGTKPFNLKIAVYNEEMETKNLIDKDHSKLLGHYLLSHIDNKTILMKTAVSVEDAMDLVANEDDMFGALVIPRLFTQNLYQRFLQLTNASDDVINNSTVKYYGDFTDMIISETITRALIEAQTDFLASMVTNYGLNRQISNEKIIKNTKNDSKLSHIFDPIIKFSEPVFGSLDPKFRDFITPGLILAVIYMMSVGLTALTIVIERKQGIMERALVSGLKMHEILASQVVLEFCIVSLQTILLMIFTFLVFETPNRGNIVLVFLLVLLQGLTGMAFGLLISSVCKDENSAIMASLGSFYPYFLISGVIWPLEGMPFTLRQFSYLLPQTLPILSLRNIMLKGWGITYTYVYLGFVSTIVWMILFLLISSIILRYRK